MSQIHEYLGDVEDAEAPPGCHVSASQICQALLTCVKKSYGRRGRSSLRAWKLERSEDVGALVFGLAEAGVLRVEPGDSASDFDGLYGPDDLDQELAQMANRDDMEHRIPVLLRAHFGRTSMSELVVCERVFPYHLRCDVQRALDAVIGRIAQVSRFSGVRRRYYDPMEGIGFSSLIHDEDDQPAMAVPPEYEEVDVGDTEPVRCLKTAIWLLVAGDMPLAVLMGTKHKYQYTVGLQIQVAAPRADAAAGVTASLFRAIEEAVQRSQSYRGKILSLEQTDDYSGRASGVRVHRLRPVQRDQVILPDSTLELLDRNVIRFLEQRKALAAYGVMAKKGVLFYGPPGTGKTHTIHYLAHALEAHTTFLMSAEQVALLDEYIALVRLLQPSILVMEDVDLIARERTRMRGACEESLLNKLLNEMDGLREDAEILFILTTNRPQMLEPALASRPGRIDQAIEFPLPDERGRRQLLRLYARGIQLADDFIAAIARKTEGVSGAFVKELMRRSLQFSLEHGHAGDVTMEDVDRAMEEMLFRGGSLNCTLLGVNPALAGSQRPAPSDACEVEVLHTD